MTTGAVIDGHLLVDALERVALGAGPRALAITRRYGVIAQTQVRANMSGRSGRVYQPRPPLEEPGAAGEIGPRAITGDLRRSVAMQMGLEAGVGGGQVTAIVYSNEPQVLRLELGFVGVDALGRHYDQPPYPAWRPAFDALEPRYARDIAALAAL